MTAEESDPLFRWLPLAVFLSAVAVSGWHRARARRNGETIDRRREGGPMLVVRALVAAILFGPVIIQALRPEWMAWASFDVPAGFRWLAAGIAVLTVPLVHWVLRTLGRNVSETVLTKEGHELVTAGPYRWVRHPLYTTGLTLFVALGILMGNWLVLVASALALLLLYLVVIPREERALLDRFGDRYGAYMRETGRLAPRLTGDGYR